VTLVELGSGWSSSPPYYGNLFRQTIPISCFAIINCTNFHPIGTGSVLSWARAADFRLSYAIVWNCIGPYGIYNAANCQPSIDHSYFHNFSDGSSGLLYSSSQGMVLQHCFFNNPLAKLEFGSGGRTGYDRLWVLEECVSTRTFPSDPYFERESVTENVSADSFMVERNPTFTCPPPPAAPWSVSHRFQASLIGGTFRLLSSDQFMESAPLASRLGSPLHRVTRRHFLLLHAFIPSLID
jgi:hypothetical protein